MKKNKDAFNAIELSVLWSRLISIVDEAGTTLQRTAFSSVTRESADFAVVLMNTKGESLAQSSVSVPSFLGVLPFLVKALIKDYFPINTWKDGDVIITNDPWLCAGHKPDIGIVTPIFNQKKLIGFIGCIAHSPDIGGTLWGAGAKDYYEEGLYIHPTKLYDQGKKNETLFKIIETNVRAPLQTIGDILAQVAANDQGIRSLKRMMQENNLSVIDPLGLQIINASEKAMRASIQQAPNGTYHAEYHADGDGLMSTAGLNDNDPSIAASVGLIAQDLDRDGTPNYLDLDSDGDGLVDNREALELDATGIGYQGLTMGTVDDDHDGVRTVNYSSNDNDADNYRGFGAKGILLRDNDNDGFPNPYDIDSDDDGITDNVEGQPTCSEIQPSGIDADGDGVDDVYDLNQSSCLRKSAGITPWDQDVDGIPDYRDLDTDNDGAPDINEGSGIYGVFVVDYNDTDGDGLIDQFDIFNIKTASGLFVNNVAHSNMGFLGSFDGPVPAGSNAQLPQQKPGVCPMADRDWRDVSILPLSLVEFKGTISQSKVAKLFWKVEHETNMSYYIVERSFNGREFKAIGQVAARGNSNNSITYTYDDNLSGLGVENVYYRLREVEKSSTFRVTHVIAFKLSDKAGMNVSIYPNPAKSFFVLRVNTIVDAKAIVRVMDMTGRNLVSSNTVVSNGNNAITIDINNIPAGTYNVQVLINGETYNQRLVVAK